MNPATAEEYFSLAHSKLRSMRVSEALQLFNRAEQVGYDADECAAGRWHCQMLLGEFEKAWQESDAIAARGRPDRHRFWDGEPVCGKSILIRCLHGLGDTLQFIRYVPLLRRVARRVVIEAQPATKELLDVCGIADQVITWGEPEPFWDQQIEVTELPRVFRTTIDTIPRQVPYLCPPQEKIDARNGRLRVGLNWASSAYNRERSIRLQQLLPVLRVNNVDFLSVQAGAERSELESVRACIADGYDTRGCVFSAAMTLAKVDLLITVDTMMAHLAGALGKPVWMLLPFQCDWRWMLERSDSPWYPTMLLFRQKRSGAWGPVIDRLSAELSKVAGGITGHDRKDEAISPPGAVQAG